MWYVHGMFHRKLHVRTSCFGCGACPCSGSSVLFPFSSVSLDQPYTRSKSTRTSMRTQTCPTDHGPTKRLHAYRQSRARTYGPHDAEARKQGHQLLASLVVIPCFLEKARGLKGMEPESSPMEDSGFGVRVNREKGLDLFPKVSRQVETKQVPCGSKTQATCNVSVASSSAMFQETIKADGAPTSKNWAHGPKVQLGRKSPPKVEAHIVLQNKREALFLIMNDISTPT